LKQLPDIELQRVKRGDERAKQILFELLRERPRGTSISHQRMPTWLEHSRFVDSDPYRCWYLIMEPDAIGATVGACYLTMNNEIGVAIFKAHSGQGYARAALQELMRAWEPLPIEPGKRAGRFLANINPKNQESINLFKSLGFEEHQVTFAHRGEES